MDLMVQSRRSRRLIEMLLLMAGVEPNPGPDRLYDCWSRDTSRYLWPTIELTETSISGRIKRLLKYFDPCTKGGKLVYAGVGATMAASNADLQARYFPTMKDAFTDQHRWDCVHAYAGLHVEWKGTALDHGIHFSGGTSITC